MGSDGVVVAQMGWLWLRWGGCGSDGVVVARFGSEGVALVQWGR